MKLPFEDVTILTDALIMYKIQYYEQNKSKTKKQSPLISPKVGLRQMSFTVLPFLTPTLHSKAADIFSFAPMTTQRTKIIMKYSTLQVAEWQRVITAPSASYFCFHPEGIVLATIL